MSVCPKCGRIMTCYTESMFGGVRTVWICGCGYCSKDYETNADSKTHEIKQKTFSITTEIGG